MELYLKAGNGFFVPSIVADHLLGIASHDQLKVLLYVLAHQDAALSAEQIASACKVRPENVEEAVSFWQDVNVLTVTLPQTTVTLNLNAASSPAPERPVSEEKPAPAPKVEQPVPAAVKPPKRPQTDSSRVNMTDGEIAERINRNSDISGMFQTLEQLAGTLTHTQMKSCIWMNEQLGLPPEVITILCAYCHEIEKFNPRYWEQIAVDWSDKGISTYALADQEIKRRQELQSYVGRTRHMFGLKPEQALTEQQQQFYESWQQKGYSVEMVSYACERSRDSKNNIVSFPFIDKVLDEWASKGITTVEAAKQEGADFAAAQKIARKNAAEALSAAPKQPADVRIDGEPSLDLSELDNIFNQF